MVKLNLKPTLISLLVTAILAGLLFRPGVWHLILYGIWQLMGNTDGEIFFILFVDSMLAVFIFIASYNILASFLKRKSNSSKKY